MELSNGEVWLAKEPLSKLMAERLPVKVAYRLAKVGKEIGERVRVIDQVRSGLVNKYGALNETGQIVVAQGGNNWNEFASEFDELMAEVEEVAIEPVLVPADHLELEANVLLPLLRFVLIDGE